MIFISKLIYDPSKPMDNRRGQTIGLTVHTPKFWNCRKFDYDIGGFWVSPPLPASIKQHRLEHERAHANCRWPYLHRSYRGYVYWTGPKRRYTIRLERPRFIVSKHHRYVRLLDNGPRYEGPGVPSRDDWMNDPVIQSWLETHREEVNEVRREMAEWRRKH